MSVICDTTEINKCHFTVALAELKIREHE